MVVYAAQPRARQSLPIWSSNPWLGNRGSTQSLFKAARGGGGVYRHHFINEQESWAVLQMNEGGVSVFWCDWVQKGPVCWPGSGTMPNGSHFPYQLIKQPYLHPSLGPEPNNGTSRGAQDCPKPPAYFQLFYIYFQLDQAETRIMITAFVSGFRYIFLACDLYVH